MAKIFSLIKARDRHANLSDFLIKSGHTNNSWKYPPVLPFRSCKPMRKYVESFSPKNELPNLCIIELDLRSDINGEDAFYCIQLMEIFDKSMPVIYLLRKGQSITLNNNTKYIYWENNVSFEEIERELESQIEEILRPETEFWDKVIDSF